LTDERDVAVVGAGPAGSACAALLAERRREVSLIDQHAFPRDKSCGDGLTPQAVKILNQLGLATFLEKTQVIEGGRVFLDHRREKVMRYSAGSQGRCVPRAFLDQALLNAALERGARLVQGRAIGLGREERRGSSTVVLADQGESRTVTARTVVASDGATSAIRRTSGLGTPGYQVRAWAIRGYYATERILEPFFDVYLPLEVRGSTLLGYGWVFPVGEYVANIGVGFLRPRGVRHMAGLRAALDAFLGELRARASRRLGDLESLGRATGAPLGHNFKAASCSRRGLLIVGDAAGTTDPLTGEGIAGALRSGVLAAQHIQAQASGSESLSTFGLAVGRRLPRIGQDLASIARLTQRLDSYTNASGEWRDGIKLLSTVAHIAADPSHELVLESLPARRLIEQLPSSPPIVAILTDAHERLLDTVRTHFPFATPLIVHEIFGEDQLMPSIALTLAASAFGQELSVENGALGALAVECLAPFGTFLARLSDRASTDEERLNNALTILTADFMVSRAMCAVSRVGPTASADLARTAREVCEGGMAEVEARYDMDSTAERHLQTIEQQRGSSIGFAAALGAEFAGATTPAREQMRRYGRSLGVAQRIAVDIAELRAIDEHANAVALSWSRGFYSLPVLLAVRRDRVFRRALTARPREDELPALLARIDVQDALDEAAAVAASYVGNARVALERAGPDAPANLVTLLDWSGAPRYDRCARDGEATVGGRS
jgi:geranylgeranyl reductase family protein